MAEWANLPYDVLSLIHKNIPVISDYFSFRGVCKSWRNVALTDGNVLISPPRWLLLAEPEHIKENMEENPTIIPRRGFIGLSDINKIYEIDLPEAHQKEWVGALGNWVVMEQHETCVGSRGSCVVTKDTVRKFQLLNPFSRIVIDLPQFKPSMCLHELRNDRGHSLNMMYCLKVVLSSSPSQRNPRECIAVANHSFYSMGRGLFYARPGDESWTPLFLSRDIYDSFLDIILFKEQLYVISSGIRGVCLDAFDIDSPHPSKAKSVVDVSDRSSDCIQYYLVEWLGELLLVIYDDDEESFSEFDYYNYEKDEKEILPRVNVYKFGLTLTTKDMEEVKSLGNYSLFVGCKHSVSVLASNSSPWKRNCIYFTGDIQFYPTDGTNVGYQEFDLEDGSIKLHSVKYYAHSSAPLSVFPNSVVNMTTD